LAPLLAAAVAAAQQPASVACAGKHFRVELHHDALPAELAGRLADEALKAAERAWPVLEKALAVRSTKPATIHLHTAEASFRAAEKRSGRPFPTEAFTVADGTESHVLLWPRLSPRVAGRVGLPSSTAYLVTFVAAEQVVAQQMQDDDGGWLQGVIAAGVTEAVTNPQREYGVDMEYDLNRFQVEGWQRRSHTPALRPMVLEEEPAKTREAWDGQTWKRALVAEQLASASPTWAAKLLARLRKRNAKATPLGQRRVAVEAILGADWDASQQRFAKTCAAARPVWQQSSPMFARVGKRWLLVGAEDRNAVIYAVAPPPDGDHVIRGTFELEPTADVVDLRLQLDWDGTDMLGVFLKPAGVSLDRWQGGKWSSITAARAEIAFGRPFDVAIEVTYAELRVRIDGTQVLSWPCRHRGMHGSWSVANSDAIAWVEGLRIEPLGAKGANAK
jgi:hypothetical protein